MRSLLHYLRHDAPVPVLLTLWLLAAGVATSGIVGLIADTFNQ